MKKNNKKLPNFFIIGAAKAGTSSLWQNLKMNKNVFMPKDEMYKEPSFFSNLTGFTDINKYIDLFRSAKDNQIVGEASTTYLTDPQSAGNIYKMCPEAKIIIILRNPANRAYSLYNWNVQEGYEYASTFEKALRLEKQRSIKKIPNFFEPQYCYNYMYFDSGLYYSQVKRYFDIFDKSNIYIIDFDDLKINFEKTYDNLCIFLGVEKNQILPKSFNKSKKTIFPFCQFILRKINNYINSNFRRDINKKELRDKLLNIGLLNKTPKKINTETRTNLLNRYEKDIYLLSELTNMDFKKWLTS
jgi:hypothetical protein